MNIRAINTPAVSDKADADVVLFLEKTLARARAGEIKGAVLITEDAEGALYEVAGIQDRYRVIGFLHFAMSRLLKE